MARNYKGKTLAKPRKRPDLMVVVRQGYLDAKQGAGFPAWYETLPKWSQNNYEFGRLCAVYLGGANAPNWPAQTILPRFVESAKDMVARDLQRYQEEGV